MALRARKVFGAFEKQAPGLSLFLFHLHIIAYEPEEQVELFTSIWYGIFSRHFECRISYLSVLFLHPIAFHRVYLQNFICYR